MATTLLGIFDDPMSARRAMDELRAGELHLEDISIISRTDEPAGAIDGHEHLGAGEGAAVGAVWGGLIGLAALLIPGVGPFIAGGVIFAALTGAAAGAVVGAVAGALMSHAGIPEAAAQNYEKLVYGGKTLLAVKAHDEDADAVRRILAHAGAHSIHDNQTDIAGIGTSVHVAHGATESWSAETELAPGGATVRGAEVMPTISPPAMPAPTSAGLPGIYDVPMSPTAVDTGSRYETAARREADNVAGSEDSSGAHQVDNQNRAILTEGWDRIGAVGDHQDTPTPEPRNSDAEEAGERSERRAL